MYIYYYQFEGYTKSKACPRCTSVELVKGTYICNFSIEKIFMQYTYIRILMMLNLILRVGMLTYI